MYPILDNFIRNVYIKLIVDNKREGKKIISTRYSQLNEFHAGLINRSFLLASLTLFDIFKFYAQVLSFLREHKKRRSKTKLNF